MGLSKAEIQGVADLLSKLEPGKLPFPIFMEFARIAAIPIVELVPLRHSSGKIEALFIEREASDPIWGGLLHTPGTVVTSSDFELGIDGILNRLVERELPGIEFISPFHHVETVVHKVKRGTECAAVYYAQVSPEIESKIGEWHDVTKLPDSVVDTQRSFIRTAAEKFNEDMFIGYDFKD